MISAGKPRPDRALNSIPDAVPAAIINLALAEPEQLSQETGRSGDSQERDTGDFVLPLLLLFGFNVDPFCPPALEAIFFPGKFRLNATVRQETLRLCISCQ